MTWESVNSYFDNDIKTTCGILQHTHTHIYRSPTWFITQWPWAAPNTEHLSLPRRSNSGPLWMIITFSDEIGFVVFPGTDGTRLLFWAALARKGTSHIISSLWSLFLNPDGTDWAMCSKVSTLFLALLQKTAGRSSNFPVTLYPFTLILLRWSCWVT